MQHRRSIMRSRKKGSAVKRVVLAAALLMILSYQVGFPQVLCGQVSPARPDRIYTYKVPERTGDGWEPLSIADAGLNPEPVFQMVQHIREGLHPNIHAVLLIKDERLVLEEYFHGYHRNRLHFQASVTKSVVSLLVGIAAGLSTTAM